MKLYYSQGACSLAPHITLQELGIPFELKQVEFAGPSGAELTHYNPMGAVPTLILDDGSALTEGAAILQYLADQKPAAKLAPAAGTMERYRLQEWLNFIASEVHKGFGPIFGIADVSPDPAVQEQIRKAAIDGLHKRFDVITQKLGSRTTLLPSGYSVADAYLFTVLSWTTFLKIDISKWTALTQFMDSVRARPATQAALKAEKLI
jgi:glutathione S-transferase